MTLFLFLLLHLLSLPLSFPLTHLLFLLPPLLHLLLFRLPLHPFGSLLPFFCPYPSTSFLSLFFPSFPSSFLHSILLSFISSFNLPHPQSYSFSICLLSSSLPLFISPSLHLSLSLFFVPKGLFAFQKIST